MNNIASVILSNCTRGFDKEYHYLIPEKFKPLVKPGIRVIVPFGKGNVSKEAYVLRLVEDKNPGELKDIGKILDEKPILSDKLLELAAWMKERYICTYSDALKAMLPPGVGIKGLKIVKFVRDGAKSGTSAEKILTLLKETGMECEYEELKSRSGLKGFAKVLKQLSESGFIEIVEEYSQKVREKTVRVAYLCRPREEIIEEIESNRIKRIQQIRILEMLLDNNHISVADLARFASVSTSVTDTLKKYGYIDFKDIEVVRDPVKRSYNRTEPLKPTEQQELVLEKLKFELDREQFAKYLLHGVTGSGKTEVYLQLIQHCFDKGRQALVLVPEISLTPQMVERFKGRFGEDVAVLHSRLSLGERFDQWKLIKDGRIKVVVGARSAIFAPFDRLGLVVIDEEHENTYKSETTPKYNAADVAEERCKAEKALLVLGSATPSVDTYYKAQRGEMGLLEMAKRANSMVMPKVEIVDMRSELDEGNRSIFSRRLAMEMEKNYKSGEQTILFLNRRGHSSFVFCRSCGYTIRCLNCNVSMTYHATDERLICHYCGYTVKSTEQCPKCKSNYIRHFGTGTQRVEDEIKKQFEGYTVIRMDMDTTTGKNSHETLLREFREKNINVLVGTQMIAKGHDFPKVTLVGVLSADSLLNTGDYNASERTFQLLTQVAGRSGRGELPGRVIIQTYNTEDFSIVAAGNHDYKSFYRQEIIVREKLEYPPFTNIGVVIMGGINDRSVFNSTKRLTEYIREKFSQWDFQADVLGPARAPLSKIKSKYRWRIIVKCMNRDILTRVFTAASDKFGGQKGKSIIDMSVDINPVNML